MFVEYADSNHTRVQAAVCIVGLVFYTDICSQVSCGGNNTHTHTHKHTHTHTHIHKYTKGSDRVGERGRKERCLVWMGF